MIHAAASPEQTQIGALCPPETTNCSGGPAADPSTRLYGGRVTLDIHNVRTSGGIPRRRYFWVEEQETLPSVSDILGLLAKPAAFDAWAAGVAAGMIENRLGIFAEREGEDGRTIGSIDAGRFADLINDAPRAPARALRDAAALSARLHGLAGRIISGKPVDLRHAGYRLANTVEALQSWLSARQPVPLAVSRVVASRRHRFAGTAGLIARINGVTTLAIFKTGRAAGSSDKLQTAAYALAFEEETGVSIARHAVIRLNETSGDFHEVLYTPAPAAEDAFLCLREFHGVFKGVGEAE
jgi:hypothetical protein